ncbi:hypothetical protein MTO96_001848 [Rhipicephalus appendiculatus]
MTPNAESAADNKQTHGPETEASPSKSRVVNTDAHDQNIQMTDTADNAPSVGHGSSGNPDTLQQSAANSSNALDCENVCVEFTVADTTAGGKDGTQENREKARSISTTDSTAGEKRGTRESREEASSKSAAGSTTEGKGRTQDNREEGSSKDSVGSTAVGKGGTQDNRGEACSYCAAVSTVEGKCEAQNNREEACSKCATTSTGGGKGVK